MEPETTLDDELVFVIARKSDGLYYNPKREGNFSPAPKIYDRKQDVIRAWNYRGFSSNEYTVGVYSLAFEGYAHDPITDLYT